MTGTAAQMQATLPPEDLEALLDLSRFLEQVTEPAALIGPDGQTVGLPSEIYEVLINVVHAMSQGRAITVAPVDQVLTTQETADFLGISRPTLVKLLESGQIPFERPAAGRHRRVRLADVVAYQQRSTQERSSALDAMTREAAELGLYKDTAQDYTAALRRAREEMKQS
ncbi:MAG: helix-turn-helix domain-containing protein [Actinomycetaceae bacterium]|nr:helix-turn-helix domain-containing protein [Actinomycetaceae bacterium]